MTDAQYYAQAFIFTVSCPDEFREGFADWLWVNIEMQRAFDAEALNVVAAGRSHYSAYTIAEYLRHHTAITQVGGDLKLNNNWVSSMARCFAYMHPQSVKLFEYREMLSTR